MNIPFGKKIVEFPYQVNKISESLIGQTAELEMCSSVLYPCVSRDTCPLLELPLEIFGFTPKPMRMSAGYHYHAALRHLDEATLGEELYKEHLCLMAEPKFIHQYNRLGGGIGTSCTFGLSQRRRMGGSIGGQLTLSIPDDAPVQLNEKYLIVFDPQLYAWRKPDGVMIEGVIMEIGAK